MSQDSGLRGVDFSPTSITDSLIRLFRTLDFSYPLLKVIETRLPVTMERQYQILPPTLNKQETE